MYENMNVLVLSLNTMAGKIVSPPLFFSKYSSSKLTLKQSTDSCIKGNVQLNNSFTERKLLNFTITASINFNLMHE